MLTPASPFSLFAAVALCGALLSGCAETQPDDALVDDDGAAQYKPVSAADAFCPQGFSYDLGNDLCLSASEAAGPFPASMIAFCKRWNPNRADGSNACETTATGAVSTRWTKTIALDARTSTRTASGCAQGTSLDTTAAYCSDGTNLFGPFTKDDVSYCKTVAGGGSACETNRVAKGMVRPKTSSRPIASFAGSYNRAAAVAYAQANWNNGDGELCQGFVSNSLRAGGINVLGFNVPNDDWVPDVYQFVWAAKSVPFDEYSPGSTAALRACPGDVVVYSNATGSNFCRPDLGGNDVIKNCGHTGLVVRGGTSLQSILANHHNGSNQNTSIGVFMTGSRTGVTEPAYATLRVYHLSNCEHY
jgi:hypothetical protein